jgi:hypothetical protein
MLALCRLEKNSSFRNKWPFAPSVRDREIAGSNPAFPTTATYPSERTTEACRGPVVVTPATKAGTRLVPRPSASRGSAPGEIFHNTSEERFIQEYRRLARGERVYGARTSNIAETDLALWSANLGFILTAI